MWPVILAILAIIIVLAIIIQMVIWLVELIIFLWPILFLMAIAGFTWVCLREYYIDKSPIHINKIWPSKDIAPLFQLNIMECGCVYSRDRSTHPENRRYGDEDVWLRVDQGTMNEYQKIKLIAHRCVQCGRYYYKIDDLEETVEVWPEDNTISPDDNLRKIEQEDIENASGRPTPVIDRE